MTAIEMYEGSGPESVLSAPAPVSRADPPPGGPGAISAAPARGMPRDRGRDDPLTRSNAALAEAMDRFQHALDAAPDRAELPASDSPA